MMLPLALREAGTHRPSIADYILAPFPTFWGLHVLYFPPQALTEIPGYSWLQVPPWGAASFVALVGAAQFAAAVLKCSWGRWIAALLAAGIFAEFAVKIFAYQPPAPGSAVDLAVALGNVSFFFWLVL